MSECMRETTGVHKWARTRKHKCHRRHRRPLSGKIGALAKNNNNNNNYIIMLLTINIKNEQPSSGPVHLYMSDSMENIFGRNDG